MNILIGLLVNALAFWVSAQLLPGVTIASWQALLLGTIILSALNTFIRPVLKLLSLPITILTLGLFSIVINGFMVMVASWISPGFSVDSFWTAILFSIILAIVSTVLGWFGRDKK